MIDFIYCHGGCKDAPKLAAEVGMLYGIRYDYTAYGDVYMLDAGLKPQWITYKRKVKKVAPTFALAPDLEDYRDPVQIWLHVLDLRNMGVPLIGVTPKYEGALAKLPTGDDIIVCVSIESGYSGYHPKDYEIIPGRYHLLGGDIRLQIEQAKRIQSLGGTVVSMDGSKLMFKAAHGQIFNPERWAWDIVDNPTPVNARLSAQSIMEVIADLSDAM